MFTVYILSSVKSPRTYVGHTTDIETRVRHHNSGKVKTTRLFRPWKVIFNGAAQSLTDVKQRERYWKSGAGRRNIAKIIKGSRPTFREKLGEARSNLMV